VIDVDFYDICLVNKLVCFYKQLKDEEELTLENPEITQFV